MWPNPRVMWWLLVCSISTEKWNQKREIPKRNSNIYLLKRANEWFVWHKKKCIDFKKHLTHFNLIRKFVQREFDVTVFTVREISIGKSFWVVNTWKAQVQKRLKRSTLHFVQVFLTRYWTKTYPRFF